MACNCKLNIALLINHDRGRGPAKPAPHMCEIIVCKLAGWVGYASVLRWLCAQPQRGPSDTVSVNVPAAVSATVEVQYCSCDANGHQRQWLGSITSLCSVQCAT